LHKEWIKILKSFIFAFGLISIMWFFKTYEFTYDKSLYFLGILPRQFIGIVGIITTPFIHGSFGHLWSNTVPFLILSASLFYFYDKKSIQIYLYLWLITGVLVWAFAKNGWHIGASGVVYALASFHITNGVIKKVPQQRAFAMLVIFLWGGIIWGIFPDFFPKQNISWESHLYGLLTGILTAIYYRNSGPKKPIYEFEKEDDEDKEEYNNDNKEDHTHESTDIKINYHLKK